MDIKIENIIPKETLKIISKENIKTINESIITYVEQELSKKSKEIEKSTSDKFNALVEGITKKFDDQVNTSIIENFKNNAIDNVNKKFCYRCKNYISGKIPLVEILHHI